MMGYTIQDIVFEFIISISTQTHVPTESVNLSEKLITRRATKPESARFSLMDVVDDDEPLRPMTPIVLVDV